MITSLDKHVNPCLIINFVACESAFIHCIHCKYSLSMGCFVRGGKNGMGCFVRGDKNSMGCYVQGDKQHVMFCPGWQIFVGCFVQGAKKWHGMFCPGMFCLAPMPKQCESRSDCSYRSSLFWVHAVCIFT